MFSCVYFITDCTYKRINLFQYNPQFAKIFLNNLVFYNKKLNLENLAHTLMPEHFHLEISPESEDFEISNFLKNFKSYTSKQILDNIKNNPHQNFIVSYCQKIIPEYWWKKLVKIIPTPYSAFKRRVKAFPNIKDFDYHAYQLHLGLITRKNHPFLPKAILENKLQNKIIKTINKKVVLTNILTLRNKTNHTTNLSRNLHRLPTGPQTCRIKCNKFSNLNIPTVQSDGPGGPSENYLLQVREILLKVTGAELLRLLSFKNKQANSKGQFYKVFRGRDRKIALGKEKDIYNVANYIFQNAFKRKLCQKPKDYPYQGGNLLKELIKISDC